MRLRDLPGAIDRTQHARWFKVAASVFIALTSVAGYVWYAVAVTSGRFGGAHEALARLGEQGAGPGADPRLRIVRGVLDEASSLSAVGVGVAATALVALITVWLGLGLTYLLCSVVGGFVAGVLMLFEATEAYGRVLAGSIALALAFTVLMQGLRVLFSGRGPVMGVARNLLTEAVRMKISLVLIVVLILGLAVLPGMLNDDQPLRYRVQSFLQYSVSGSFWVMAALTLAFGVASITGEQRDKVIWQTVTKPVAKWEYLFGKWLGLVGLNAVLLLVSSSGAFLFVEYLRAQPAVGETRAYIGEDTAVTEDRFLLETRVLTARRSRGLDMPEELSMDSPAFQSRVEDYIADERIIDPDFATTPQMRAKVVSDLHESALRAYRSIPNGDRRLYTVSGLGEARESGRPITLSMRIDAMGNRPDIFFTLSFIMIDVPDAPPMIEKLALGRFHNFTLPARAIGEGGVLELIVFNGELRPGAGVGEVGIIPNQAAALMPEDGFEVSYRAGGYQLNYLRVMLVLWIKLAFLAMVAVFTSTFLSFPVACLVAFGVFLLAEMSGFLATAVETYSVRDREGGVIWWKVIFSGVTELMSGVFAFYSELKPVRRLVDGRLMPWSSVAGGMGFLGLLSLLLFLASVLIFRRRELATYSGQ